MTTIVYKDSSTPVELRADSETRTIWATQRQIAEIFRLDVSVVNRHIKNYKEQIGREVQGIAKFAIPTAGGTQPMLSALCVPLPACATCGKHGRG